MSSTFATAQEKQGIGVFIFPDREKREFTKRTPKHRKAISRHKIQSRNIPLMDEVIEKISTGKNLKAQERHGILSS